jgi:hypothetical protein
MGKWNIKGRIGRGRRAREEGVGERTEEEREDYMVL